MFVVTFDEDDSNTKSNRVYAALFGPDFKRSSKSRKDHKKYDHYSLLRTIENNVSTPESTLCCLETNSDKYGIIVGSR